MNDANEKIERTQAPIEFAHGYAFDPSYGYSLADLLAVSWPEPPDDFREFWDKRYRSAIDIDPAPTLKRSVDKHPAFRCYDINYRSTDDFIIGGWLLLPHDGVVTRGVVVGHGYGGREAPDFQLQLPGTALLFPCFRGMSRSARAPISQDPNWHVLHDIDNVDRYILGGCVEDVWLGVSALLALYPWLDGRIGYSGISFGGGVGALAIPWDSRIRRGHLNVPTFGNHPLRMTLPSEGSSGSLARYYERHSDALNTLRYYDAATASRFVRMPMHVAVARFDPMVPPPGQFAVFNALPQAKSLFLLDAGHFEYPNQVEQDKQLISELSDFFNDL